MGVGDPLHITRLNLFSTQAKKTLAGHLRAQINSLEWNTLIEQLAQRTITEYRKGEPVVIIGAHPLRPGSRWRLEGLIPEGDIALLFGPGGSGKSFLALAFGMAVSHGWDGLGLKVEQGPVLYLDWEWGWQEHNDRLLALEAGMDLKFKPSIVYRYCSHEIDNEIETIQQIVVDKNIKLVIVDSLVPALGGAKNAKENAEPLFTSLRSLPGTSALVISHTAKDPEAKTRSPYGDVFSTNRPRHVIEMRAVSETEGQLDIALYKHKSNLPPARLKGLYPIGFRLATGALGTSLERIDVFSVPALAERMGLKGRLLDFLKLGPATKAAIALALSSSPAQVQARLSELKRAGLLVLLPNSSWALASKEFDDE